MIKVLFVCLGNICRSPMAEAVFMHKVKQAGLQDKICADSAGTGSWHVGEPPHSGTRRTLNAHGIEYTHAARVLTASDFDDFDIILTMDADNYAVAKARGKGRAELRRFLEFAPDVGISEVPDPWYTGDFEQTHELVSEAADGLLEYLNEKYKIGQ